MSEDNALVPIKTEYSVLKADRETMIEVFDGAKGLTARDLPKIKIPSSGSKFWTLPTVDGDKPSDSFTGIVLMARDGRVYWEKGVDEGGGGSPPDCSSNDGEIGYGIRMEEDDPGPHSCVGDNLKGVPPCPFSLFKSDGGRGQKCKQIKVVFVLRQSEFLPTVLVLPPTSLKNAKDMLVRIISQGKNWYDYEIKWSLEVTENPDKIKYSKAVPTIVRELSPDEKKAVRGLAARYKEIFSKVKVQTDVDQESVG